MRNRETIPLADGLTLSKTKTPDRTVGGILYHLSDQFPYAPHEGDATEDGEKGNDLARDLTFDIDREQGIFGIFFAFKRKRNVKMTIQRVFCLLAKALCLDFRNGDLFVHVFASQTFVIYSIPHSV